MTPSGQCRSCKAPVRWVLVEPARRMMPVDPEPVKDGNMWVSEHTIPGPIVMSVAATPDDVPASVLSRYKSHFVTCPDAATWRKK